MIIIIMQVQNQTKRTKVFEKNLRLTYEKVPDGFELPIIGSKKLGICWSHCFYKSKEFFSPSSRRYTAKCKYCLEEFEARPKTLEKHISVICPSVSSFLKTMYLDTIQNQHKKKISNRVEYEYK